MKSIGFVATVALTALVAACATGGGGPGLGNLLEFRGPDVEGVLDTSYAETGKGGEWLFLNLMLSGTRRADTTVTRSEVWLITPDGRQVPMVDQEQFAQAYGELQGRLTQFSVASRPLEYYREDRAPCGRWFFSVPTSPAPAFDELYLNDRRYCEGLIAFELPADVPSGSYRLVIEQGEQALAVPFHLDVEE